jgi:hypothetical protein
MRRFVFGIACLFLTAQVFSATPAAANGPVVEEHIHGETIWVALRCRGADWSWLTPAEALQLATTWIEQYGCPVKATNESYHPGESGSRIFGNQIDKGTSVSTPPAASQATYRILQAPLKTASFNTENL